MLMKQLMGIALSLMLAINTSQGADVMLPEGPLTPLGGERAGNASGTIPAWNGGITEPPQGYKGSGSRHVDPYAGDEPLFTITRANLDQHREHLTPGQVAMFETYPATYQMPIYPPHRSASAPQWVYDNTRRNAGTARLISGGNGFVDAYGGIPFPVPKKGIQAIWNHIARY
ncbi:DUF1329 domain-containing protein, partial [Pseudomonas syringae]